MVLLALALSCPPTLFIPKGKMVARDLKESKVAAQVCKQTYGPTSCLFKFIKIEPRTYYALCKDINS